MSQFTRVTDRRTDGRTDGQTDTFAVAKTALHICSAVKTAFKDDITETRRTEPANMTKVISLSLVQHIAKMSLCSLITKIQALNHHANFIEYKMKRLHMPGAEEVSKQTPTMIQQQIMSLIILALVSSLQLLQLNTYTYSVECEPVNSTTCRYFTFGKTTGHYSQNYFKLQIESSVYTSEIIGSKRAFSLAGRSSETRRRGLSSDVNGLLFCIVICRRLLG